MMLETEPPAWAASNLDWPAFLEAIDRAGIGMAICDSGGFMTYINSSHTTMYGYCGRHELIGQHWSVLYSGEELEKYETKHIPLLLQTGHWKGYSTARKKDGSPFDERVWLYKLEGGGILCFCQDITEEERLARERDGFFEQNGCLAVVTSTDGVIADCNSSFRQITGLDHSQAAGRKLSEVCDCKELSTVLRALATAEEGATVGCRSLLATGSAECRTIAWIASKLKGSNRIFLIGSDVSSTANTERQVEAALAKERELVEIKTRFFSLANHELRTPLSVISLTAEALVTPRSSLTQERREQLGATLLERVDECRCLLEKFMQLDRHFSGRMQFNPRPCLPAVLLDEIVAEVLLYRSHPRAADVMVEADSVARGQRLLDAELLRPIVINLLENAIKYSRSGSLITVRLVAKGDDLLVSVADRGVGIPSHDAPKVFEPFFRSAKTAERPGSGLGLPLAKLCATAHCGELVFSSAEGRGSTFTARLYAPPLSPDSKPRPFEP